MTRITTIMYDFYLYSYSDSFIQLFNTIQRKNEPINTIQINKYYTKKE